MPNAPSPSERIKTLYHIPVATQGDVLNVTDHLHWRGFQGTLKEIEAYPGHPGGHVIEFDTWTHSDLNQADVDDFRQQCRDSGKDEGVVRNDPKHAGQFILELPADQNEAFLGMSMERVIRVNAYDPPAGEHLETAFKNAQAQALAIKQPVKMNFDRIELTAITPDSQFSDVVDELKKGRAEAVAKQYAYQAQAGESLGKAFDMAQGRARDRNNPIYMTHSGIKFIITPESEYLDIKEQYDHERQHEKLRSALCKETLKDVAKIGAAVNHMGIEHREITSEPPAPQYVASGKKPSQTGLG